MGDKTTPKSASETVSSSARRRHALREFYKLQAEAPPKPETPASSEDDLEQIHPESAIDKEGITVEEYITNIVRNNDLKKILETENGLVNEIRGLESEKKALIYNNYSKLILAINTLDSVRQDDSMSEQKLQKLTESMKSVSELSKKLLKPSETSGNGSTDNTHVAKWLLTVPESNRRLVENGQIEEAKTRATIAIDLLEKINLKGETIQKIKEDCHRLIAEDKEGL
jgi:vacuolar protein sorting-associated protein 51